MNSNPVDPEALRQAAEPVGMDRRRFLALGGGAALVSMGGFVSSAARAASRQLDIRYVVTDRRYPESLQFGQVLATKGSIPLEVTGGLTKLWQEALAPLWREPGARRCAVAGLTSREVWVCLAEQARSRGRQTVFAGRHTFESQSSVAAHVITEPYRMPGSAARIESHTHAWPRALAERIGQCPADARVCGSEWRSGSPLQLSGRSHSLTSWVIV